MQKKSKIEKYDENTKEINSVEKYKKIKMMEKKMNDVADTINNLDENDKQKILETIKENAKNNDQKNKYKKLVTLFLWFEKPPDLINLLKKYWFLDTIYLFIFIENKEIRLIKRNKRRKTNKTISQEIKPKTEDNKEPTTETVEIKEEKQENVEPTNENITP